MSSDVTAEEIRKVLKLEPTFHTARITGHRRWFLGGGTEWPGVDPTRDVELGDTEELAAKFPEAAADIRDLPKPQEPPPPPQPEPEPAKYLEPAHDAAPPETPPEPDKPQLTSRRCSPTACDLGHEVAAGICEELPHHFSTNKKGGRSHPCLHRT